MIVLNLQEPELKRLIQQAVSETLETMVKSNLPKHNNEEKSIYTRAEAAKFLKISLPTLDSYAKKGKIAVHRIGKKIRYKADDLNNALSKISYN